MVQIQFLVQSHLLVVVQLVDQLLDRELIWELADLYQLKLEQLEHLERMGTKSAHNVLQELETSKQVPFHQVLFGLGIRHVGAETARLLTETFFTLEALAGAGEEALAEVPGVGPRRRRALLQRFGGLQGLKRANVDDLASVRGISRELAQRIFDFFHGNPD